MTDFDLSRVLTDGVELLSALVRDRVEPGEALARTEALARQVPDVQLDLVWERRDFLGDRHYDLLIRRDERTLSLSVCAAADVPWVLRGVTRWSEKDIVSINGEAVGVAEAIAALELAWGELDVAGHLVDQALLRQLATRGAIPGCDLTLGPDGVFVVEPGELQAAFDAFRTRHGLEAADALTAWLDRRGITLAQLEDHLRGAAAQERIRSAVAAALVEAHFASHGADYDRLDVVRCGPLDDDDIAELHRAPAQLHAIAERAFLADPRVEIGYATYARHQLAPEMAAALFGAAIGHVAGPFEGEMARVLRFRPAVLDRELRQIIEKRLFAAWLAERRADARIEWLWGSGDR